MTEREIIENLAALLKESATRVHDAAHRRKHTFANCPHQWCETVKEALSRADAG